LEDPFNPGFTATVRQVAYTADGTLWAASGSVGLHVLAPSPPRRRAITH
jgi:hypothetical protein